MQRVQRHAETNIVRLLNAFLHHGPLGRYMVLIYELMGVSLADLISEYDGLQVEQCRSVIK